MPICPSCGGTPFQHAPDCDIGLRERQDAALRARNRGGGCGCLLITIAAVVAVVGFAFDLVAGQIAPDRGLTARHAADIRTLTGVWEGHYTCEGRRRGLRLAIGRAPTKGPDLRATFVFFKGSKAAGEPLGSFTMEGEYDGRRLDLRPDSWEGRRPAGYRMVDLLGTGPRGEPPVLTGDVARMEESCKAFRVTKRS